MTSLVTMECEKDKKNKKDKEDSVVVFIHGFGKSSSDWNVSDYGKVISIEMGVKQYTNTVLVNLKDDDYLTHIQDTCDKIVCVNNLVTFKHVHVVAHSYGCFYAMVMAEKYKTLVKSLVLIELTVKTHSYKLYLQSQHDSISQAKVNNYDTLPDGSKIPNKTVISTHIAINSKDTNIDYMTTQFQRLEYYKMWTNNNTHNELVLHPCKSHMLHYHVPHKIISCIIRYVCL